jgi:hypothetical protein
LNVTGVATFSAAPIYSSLTASSAVATDASKALVSVTNTGTGNNVLATSPTLVTPVLGAASATSVTFDAGAVGTPSITTTGDTNTGIFFPAADTIAFSEGGVESMRIDSSGNVGIGTASPRLVANYTTLSLNNTAGALFDMSAAGTRIASFGADGAGFSIASVTSIPIAFSTNNTERMRIDSSGNLMVGKTSAGGYKFGVVGGASYAAILECNSANIPLVCQITSGTGAQTFVGFYNGATNTGNITTTGTNTLYGSISDYRLKENIVPLTGALAKVQELKPVNWKWKSDGLDGQGFIAHELQAVVPDCVSGEKDAVDADGNPKYQGVDTSFLVATLTAAIQEQQALITSLTARITALESN